MRLDTDAPESPSNEPVSNHPANDNELEEDDEENWKNILGMYYSPAFAQSQLFGKGNNSSG